MENEMNLSNSFEDFIEEDNDLSKRSIHTNSADAQVDALHQRYKRGRLNIQPDYQRQYVWDRKKASLLIESILLGIPIPIIYLAEDNIGHVNVIDGQQRLTSLFSFIDGQFPDGKKFKLSGLNVFTELRNKAFSELPTDKQDAILEYPLRTITFTKDSDPDLQYEIFARLNTGSVALNDQELRNCIYRGTFNDLLKELSGYEEFRWLLGLQTAHPRMKDVELVLRFVAFYLRTYINYTSPSKGFLNDVMREKQQIDAQDIKKIKDAFKKAVLNTKTFLGQHAFRRYYIGKQTDKNGYWDYTINLALFQITMDSMARIDSNVLMRHLDALREAYIDLIGTNQEFIYVISNRSADTLSIQKQFKMWNDVINNIIGDDKAESRCFSYEFKRMLYGINPTCAICHQHISSIDDCAVDHIEQYWMGGKTIPENARLAHRYCNCARPKNDIVQ